MESGEVEPIFENLKIDDDYEISNNLYPFIIRRKSNNHACSVWTNKKGYCIIKLNSKPYRLHRIIAQQFIENPNNFPEVDHINHNKQDNRIENLRWVSTSDNGNNRTIYKGIESNYFDELSKQAIKVLNYGNFNFNSLYFDNNKFYYYTGEAYRELHYLNENGCLLINTTDINKKKARIYLNKFKKLYKLN